MLPFETEVGFEGVVAIVETSMNDLEDFVQHEGMFVLHTHD